MKLWIVGNRDYEDYHVVAIFDSEEKAKKCAKLVAARIEEPRELNDFAFEKPPVGMGYHHVVLNCQSSPTTRVNKRPFLLDDSGKVLPTVWCLSIPGCKTGPFQFSSYARDEDHAIEIASECHTKVLAGALPENSNRVKP